MVLTINDKIIYKFAYEGNTSITELIIGDDVETIESYAFQNCSNLTTITISENSKLSSVGYTIFDGTAWYKNQSDGVIYLGKVLCGYKGEMPQNTSLNIREGTVCIAMGAFSDLTNLTSIFIPESVTWIGESAFSYSDLGTPGLVSVTFAELSKLKFIGEWAFGYCYFLETIKIPSSVTDLDSWVFDGCYSLESVEFEAGTQLVEIKERTFQNCANLTSITIPKNVLIIGMEAFIGCSKLKSVAFEKGSKINSIKLNAFLNCTNLTDIYFNSAISINSIGDYAFSGCSSNLKINVSDINVWLASNFKSLDANPLTYYNKLYLNGTLVTTLDIPKETTYIGNYVFYNYTNLNYFNLPENPLLSLIGFNAFEGCGEVIVDMSAIEDWCKISFANEGANPIISNENLFRVQGVPVSHAEIKNTAIIGNYAFCKTSITEVSLSDNVKNIGFNSFYNCSKLTRVNIPNIDMWFNINFLNLGANPLHAGASLYVDDYEYTTLFIPENVTKIGNYLFYGCKSITDILIGNKITHVGAKVFNNTPWYDNQSDGIIYLNNILYEYKGTIPANTSISVKNGTTFICSESFKGQTINSVTIPESVVFIGNDAFKECTITSTKFPNLLHWCTNITFENGCANPLSASTKFFVNGKETTSVKLRDINALKARAFYGCQSLVEFNGLDDFIEGTEDISTKGVSIIEDEAFCGCSNLTKLNIAISIQWIGNRAFYGCRKAKVLQGIANGEKALLCYIGISAFEDCGDISNGGRIFLGNKLETINIRSFYNSTVLAEWGYNVKHIGNEAFRNAKNVSILDYVLNSIGDYAFAETDIAGFRNVNNISIGEYAFYSCKSLQYATIPNAKSIGQYAFLHCHTLNKVILGTNLKRIEKGTFHNCNISNIFIPHSVLYIGNMAFYDNAEYSTFNFGTHLEVPLIVREYNPDEDEFGSLYYSGVYNLIIQDNSNIKKGLKNQGYDNLNFIDFGDGKDSYDIKVKQMIRFNIDNKTFIAEKGMTWEKWLASDYSLTHVLPNDVYLRDGYTTGQYITSHHNQYPINTETYEKLTTVVWPNSYELKVVSELGFYELQGVNVGDTIKDGHTYIVKTGYPIKSG